MSDIRISTYSAPRWGSKTTGNVTIHKDTQARYFVDNVSITNTQIDGLFTILTCVDNAKHYVLTVFFRLIDRVVEPEQEPA